jgi:hypothetical protein
MTTHRHHNGTLHITPPRYCHYRGFQAVVDRGDVIAVLHWNGAPRRVVSAAGSGYRAVIEWTYERSGERHTNEVITFPRADQWIAIVTVAVRLDAMGWVIGKAE